MGGRADHDRRLELLREQPATAPHDDGVIVIDDSWDRKDGTATAHVGRQWLGRLGKTDNGIVTVTTVWTDGRVYHPLHATPWTRLTLPLVVATTDPAGLPEKATWYLATNLPHPDAPHATTSPHPSAALAEIVRLYGLRPWIEQSYKQVKDELAWADFQVRSDRAIRRHQTLVNCAFSFCWDQWFAPPGPLDATAPDPCPDEGPERGGGSVPPAPTALLTKAVTGHPFLAHPCRHPQPMMASLDGHRPALRTPGTDRCGHHRTRHGPLPPDSTNYR